MQFIDTNIFIRHLTGDDAVKAQACLALFQKAQRNEIALTTSETIVAEVVYVLSSRQLYNLPRTQIRALLYPLLSLRGLKLAYRKTYLRALDLYATYPIDFEDAMAVAHMERQKITDIVSYDKGFDRIPAVGRQEP
jgi:predicted nucleic acid-binding protein